MRLVIALGGNALLPRGAAPDERVQVERLEQVARDLAYLGARHEVVIVHGNGPQVGMLALESAADTSLSGSYPMDDLVAETQGLIGYWIQRTVGRHLRRPVVTLVSQTVVDADDPALQHPTKPVGVAYPEDQARILAARHGWALTQEAAGWRRVVPSPRPQRVVESGLCRSLLDLGATVVMAGGGGIPVVRRRHGMEGIEAVVDKDLTAAVLAVDLRADALVILTDVPAIYRRFGTPGAEPLGHVVPADLEGSSFSAGSMGPKVEAVVSFVRRTGGRAAIGALDDLRAVTAGRSGTQVRSRWSHAQGSTAAAAAPAPSGVR